MSAPGQLAVLQLLEQLNSLDIQLWVEEDRLRYRGPKGAMTPPLRAKVADFKADIITLLQGKESASPSLASIVPISRDESLPLSFAQQRLWFLDQLEGPTATYNVGGALRLSGRLNIVALTQAFNEIVRRHEALRTVFHTVGDQPVQVILPASFNPLPIVDLPDSTGADQDEAIRQLALAEIRRPFELESGPLLRVLLIQLDQPEWMPDQEARAYALVYTMHHIISDGWSMGVFGEELTRLYGAFANNQPSPLAPLPIQYADFAHWQRDRLQGAVLAAEVNYWKTQLGPPLPVLNLPTDRPRPAIQTSHGIRQSFRLTQTLTDDLQTLSRRAGVSLFMTLLAGFQVLLHWQSGQTDIVVGTDVANRQRTELEDLIGFFVNQLVLRTDLSGDPSFYTLLERVRDVTLDAYAHQDLPFDKLVEALNPKRDTSRSPLFQVKFVLQNAPGSALNLPDLTWEPLNIDKATAKFDWLLDMWDTGQGLYGELEYNTDLFNHSTITRLLGHFEQLLQTGVSQPEARLGHLVNHLTEADREQRQLRRGKVARRPTLKRKRQGSNV